MYSESKEIYVGIDKTVKQIDKIIVVSAMVFFLPGVMFPKFILSYLAYYTKDLGSEAFELPFPCW